MGCWIVGSRVEVWYVLGLIFSSASESGMINVIQFSRRSSSLIYKENSYSYH